MGSRVRGWGRGRMHAPGRRLSVVVIAGAVLLGCSPNDADAVVPTRSVVFVTYNVMKSLDMTGVPSWAVRLPKIERTLLASGADVMGLTETTEHQVGGGVTQWGQMQEVLRPAGYVAPRLEENQCRRLRNCNNSVGMLYRASTVEQVPGTDAEPAAGFVRMDSMVAGLTADASMGRVAYALLRPTGGTTPLLAVAVHYPQQKDAAHERDRVVFSQGVTGWMTAKAARLGYPNAPMVLLGDLNSYAARQPQGAQWVLTEAGWQDAFTAPVVKGGKYATINITPKTRKYYGFPPRPHIYRKDPTRLDYVFAWSPAVPTEYRTVVQLLKNGRFNRNYQGSDHNLVRAVLQVPG